MVVLLVALALPFSPLAQPLGFKALPAGYFVFLPLAAATYLLIVQLAKRPLMRRYMD
jgi:Mg2+-importing ATPase